MAPAIAARAAALDATSAFPADDIAALRDAGILRAPIPAGLGGLGAGTEPGGAGLILRLMLVLGRANLSVARLIEAHVNALRLIMRFGDPAASAAAAADARAGHLFGLWVTDGPQPLTACGERLAGIKGPCSGAGFCTRALVTATAPEGVRMAVVALGGAEPVDPVSGMQGMRAAANGLVTLGGATVLHWIGQPGDYLAEPDFSCGAWRATAAAAGALEALVAAVAQSLRERGQAAAPMQLARFGQMLMARQTALLWAERLATVAEGAGDPAEQVATVNLGRLAVESACLDVIRLAQRSLGMAAFLAPHPAERIVRDLGVYLRQPAPDAVLLEAASWHLEHFPTGWSHPVGSNALKNKEIEHYSRANGLGRCSGARMRAGEALAAMRALPVAGLAEILRGGRPLVLAPHADDESLGCGGLLAQAAAAGSRPAVLVLTDGTGSHPRSRRYPPPRLRAVRETEARAAAAILGVEPDRVGFLGLPDTAAPVAGPAFEAAVDAIVATLRTLDCTVLLAPWRHDPHGDHEAAHLMAAEAARRGGHRHLSYPVWGWTLPPDHLLAGPAAAGWRLDVSPQRTLKQRAIGAHRSQHAGLIDDDPDGFHLPAGFVDLFTGPFETFLEEPAIDA